VGNYIGRFGKVSGINSGNVIAGTVFDGSNTPIQGVTVTASGGHSASTTTDANGCYIISGVASSVSVTLTPAKSGYTFTPASVNTNSGSVVKNFTGAALTYDPATFFTGATLVWYPFHDSSQVLDASDAPAANNVKVKTITDKKGSNISLVQATAGDQATCKTGVVNGAIQAIEYTESIQGYIPQNFSSYLNSATSLTVGLVHSLSSGSNNADILRCYENSYSYDRVRAFFLGLRWGALWNTKDSTNEGIGIYSDPAVGVSADIASYNATLWEFDFSNGRVTVFGNGGTKITQTTNGTAQAIPNTNLNEPHVLKNMNGRAVDLFWTKDVKMTSQQRSDWFSTVKAYFGLTTY